MKKVLNLTQHAATAEQFAAGVVEPADKKQVQALLTFEELPAAGVIAERAKKLAQLAKAAGVEVAMIGGAPFFMASLEKSLRAAGVKSVYAFSKRESVDEKQADGSVKKIQVFRHAGFVEAAT